MDNCQLKKFLFLVTAAILNGGRDCQILKGTHPRTIPARFGLIWFRGFRGEDLNVKVYDVRRTDGQTDRQRWMPSDGKSSPGQRPGELKNVKT